jgi:hypothetical protein
MKTWPGFIWSRIGFSGELFKQYSEPASAINTEFLNGSVTTSFSKGSLLSGVTN